MERLTIRDPATGTTVRASAFQPGSGVTEVHFCGSAPGTASVEKQSGELHYLYRAALEQLDLREQSVVFRRIYVPNGEAAGAGTPQLSLARTGEGGGLAAVSVVGQPVSPGGGLGFLAYHISDKTPLEKVPLEDGLMVRRPGCDLVWQAGLPRSTTLPADPVAQTEVAFGACAAELAELGGSVEEHLLRTWVHVDDIDRNYQAMSDARRELFLGLGLNSRTHYVVSTGIGASLPGRDRVVSLDAWAAIGINGGQIRYLRAPHLLSRTDLYGVTFERGAVVSYGDRRHVLLAGTASCSADGSTLHVGNLGAQLERAMANIEGLLAEADASASNLAYLLAYVRNNEDGDSVRTFLEDRGPDIPLLVVHGPVCRPNWLVEVEGAAVLAGGDPDWPPF